jgi:hypothetical protein
MKAKFLACSGGEFNQIKCGGPLLAKAKAKLLSLVAIVPDVVYCAGLFAEFTVKALNSIAIHFNHAMILSLSMPYEEGNP